MATKFLLLFYLYKMRFLRKKMFLSITAILFTGKPEKRLLETHQRTNAKRRKLSY